MASKSPPANPNTESTQFDMTAEVNHRFSGNHKGTDVRCGAFTFTSFAPRVYARLREEFGFGVAFERSMCGSLLHEFRASNSKSGSFFFFTGDGRLMIKTIKPRESRVLRDILPRYTRHMTDHPNSLLSKLVGHFCVRFDKPLAKCNNRAAFHFIIMDSVFGSGRYVHRIYDLKGSTKGRTAKQADLKQAPNQLSTNAVLMDNDMREGKLRIDVGDAGARALKKRIWRDTDFLKKLGIVDYSLIVGVSDTKLPDPRLLSPLKHLVHVDAKAPVPVDKQSITKDEIKVEPKQKQPDPLPQLAAFYKRCRTTDSAHRELKNKSRQQRSLSLSRRALGARRGRERKRRPSLASIASSRGKNSTRRASCPPKTRGQRRQKRTAGMRPGSRCGSRETTSHLYASTSATTQLGAAMQRPAASNPHLFLIQRRSRGTIDTATATSVENCKTASLTLPSPPSNQNVTTPASSFAAFTQTDVSTGEASGTLKTGSSSHGLDTAQIRVLRDFLPSPPPGLSTDTPPPSIPAIIDSTRAIAAWSSHHTSETSRNRQQSQASATVLETASVTAATSTRTVFGGSNKSEFSLPSPPTQSKVNTPSTSTSDLRRIRASSGCTSQDTSTATIHLRDVSRDPQPPPLPSKVGRKPIKCAANLILQGAKGSVFLPRRRGDADDGDKHASTRAIPAATSHSAKDQQDATTNATSKKRLKRKTRRIPFRVRRGAVRRPVTSTTGQDAKSDGTSDVKSFLSTNPDSITVPLTVSFQALDPSDESASTPDGVGKRTWRRERTTRQRQDSPAKTGYGGTTKSATSAPFKPTETEQGDLHLTQGSITGDKSKTSGDKTVGIKGANEGSPTLTVDVTAEPNASPAVRAAITQRALHLREKQMRRRTLGKGGSSDETYYVGIVDFLSHWGLVKRSEYFYKSKIRRGGDQVTVLPPAKYCSRFRDFVKEIIQ